MRCVYFSITLTVSFIITVLPSYGMNPDQQLLNALYSGDRVQAEQALDRGAQLNTAPDKWDMLPLHRAAYSGHVALVKLFLEKGADATVRAGATGGTPLYWAIKGYKQQSKDNNIEIVRLLLGYGADAYAKVSEFTFSNTPLHAAAAEPSRELMELLLTTVPNVTLQNEHGETPLHSAALCDNFPIVELLLDQGADIHAQSKTGATPLHCAGWHNLDTVHLLLRRGAQINCKNKVDQTPLLLAIKADKRNIVELVRIFLSTSGIIVDGNYLQVAWQQWTNNQEKADKQEAYKTVGHMLVKHLGLYTNRSTISRYGIVGAYGLPEEIARRIASFMHN